MKRGVTLVELLIAISIMILLAATAVPIYGNLQNLSQKEEATYSLLQSLRLARQDSLSGVNNYQHGVKFFSDHYIVFQGDAFTTRTAALDRNIKLSPSLSLTNDFLNNEIVFSRGGLPNSLGTLTISEVNGQSRVITVNKFGIAKIE